MVPAELGGRSGGLRRRLSALGIGHAVMVVVVERCLHCRARDILKEAGEDYWVCCAL